MAQKADVTIMIIGLDNAGKTTLIAAFGEGEWRLLPLSCVSINTQPRFCSVWLPPLLDEDANIVPTIGFSQPLHMTRQGKRVVMYDLGGGPRIRGVWESYYADVMQAPPPPPSPSR